jgi:hypothetical protein
VPAERLAAAGEFTGILPNVGLAAAQHAAGGAAEGPRL